MKRIVVIGPGGAGKSRLSLTLGEILGIEVFHMDREFWKPGWVPSTRAEQLVRLDEICAREEWITDGNYGGTMDVRLEAADAVVFLDLNPLRCCLRVLWRGLRDRSGTRPDMAPGCPEQIPGWDFLWWILTYRRRRRPGVLERLDGMRLRAEIHVLRTPCQVHRFLADLRARPPDAPTASRPG